MLSDFRVEIVLVQLQGWMLWCTNRPRCLVYSHSLRERLPVVITSNIHRGRRPQSNLSRHSFIRIQVLPVINNSKSSHHRCIKECLTVSSLFLAVGPVETHSLTHMRLVLQPVSGLIRSLQRLSVRAEVSVYNFNLMMKWKHPSGHGIRKKRKKEVKPSMWVNCGNSNLVNLLLSRLIGVNNSNVFLAAHPCLSV